MSVAMASFLRSLGQRAVTGFAFVGVLAAGFVIGPVTYAVVMTILITLATMEFCRLTRVGGYKPHFFIALAVNVVAFVMAFQVNMEGFDHRFFLVIIGLFWFTFLYELFSVAPHPMHNIALTALCCIYIGMPFTLFNLLAFKGESYDFWPILGLFLLVWANDTGAYLAGNAFGRHKLYERISPKKTVEGFLGGVLLTVVVALVAALWLGDCFFHEGWKFSLAAALIVGLFGTAGDLVESMLKRSVEAKDSGHLLPGHGGILDRCDSVIFVTPIVSLMYYFFF